MLGESGGVFGGRFLRGSELNTVCFIFVGWRGGTKF